jgi:nicotinamidase-related amidase
MSNKILASDSVVLFADLQENIIGLTKTNPEKLIRKNALALAKLAKLFDIPAIATMVGGEKAPELIGEVEEGYGPIEVFLRSTADSFQNEAIRAKLASLGRKTLLIGGVATEIVVTLAALGGVDNGYRVYVLPDISGSPSDRTEAAAMARLAAAGVSVTTVLTLSGELAGDFTSEKGQQARGILFGLVS